MRGRSITEAHRVASPLELLFDLVFAASFAVAGSQLAHGIQVGHYGPAILAFCFVMFAIIWAWINYTWFASAFDTDDWLFRVLTMLQMVGVIILAIGIPQVFQGLDEHGTFNNQVLVAGYVVMRVAMVAQWLRASRTPQYRVVARKYALGILIAQAGWILTAILPLTIWVAICVGLVLWAIEMLTPVIAESKGARHGSATPWHPHHIAERYSLLTIITLGETVLGTLAAAQMITESDGWTFDSIAVIAIGIALTFALWWQYFMLPSGAILSAHRERGFGFGYGHIVLFASTAAIGAALHVVGYVYDNHHEVSPTVAVTALAIPVVGFMLSMFLLYQWLVRQYRAAIVPQTLALLLPVVGIVLSGMGVAFWVCLLFVLAGPVTVVVQVEMGGWRPLNASLAKASAKEPTTEA